MTRWGPTLGEGRRTFVSGGRWNGPETKADEEQTCDRLRQSKMDTHTMHGWKTKHMGGVMEANRTVEGGRGDEEAPGSNAASLDRKEAFLGKSCELPTEVELEELQEFLLQVDSDANVTKNFDTSKRQLADDRMVRASQRKDSNVTAPSEKRISRIASVGRSVSPFSRSMVLSTQQQTADRTTRLVPPAMQVKEAQKNPAR